MTNCDFSLQFPVGVCEDWAESILCALRLFNDFCTNSWYLGGYEQPDTSDTRYVKYGNDNLDISGINTSNLFEDEEGITRITPLATVLFANSSLVSDIKTRYTTTLALSIEKLMLRWRHGNILPWERIDGENFNVKKGLPEIIQLCIKSGLFAVRKSERTNVMMFDCAHCHQSLNVREAESHIYTRDYRLGGHLLFCILVLLASILYVSLNIYKIGTGNCS